MEVRMRRRALTTKLLPIVLGALGGCATHPTAIDAAGTARRDAQDGERAAASPLAADLDAAVKANEAELLDWRRHLHAHPELSNHEVETAAFVAEHLRAMGLAPRTGVAKNGVVAV